MAISTSELDARVVHEAGGVLVVDKCPGLPTSGRSLDDPDCLQSELIARERRAGRSGGVWAVHQLDADTSGLNLFVTEKRLVAALKAELMASDARKSYLALVHGAPEWGKRVVEAPIGFVSERSLGVTPEGRAARTELRVVARAREHALVEARITTGRTHQVRIHLAHLGHPLVGEEWYRDPPCALHPRQALHAWRLELASLRLEAPWPRDLAELAAALGFAGGPAGADQVSPSTRTPPQAPPDSARGDTSGR